MLIISGYTGITSKTMHRSQRLPYLVAHKIKEYSHYKCIYFTQGLQHHPKSTVIYGNYYYVTGFTTQIRIMHLNFTKKKKTVEIKLFYQEYSQRISKLCDHKRRKGI